MDSIILQHMPRRQFYDGFENYRMGGLDREMQILEWLAQKLMLTLNHEGMNEAELKTVIADFEAWYERPVTDVLTEGSGKLVTATRARL